jgi:general L-amino acid transport system permease protein
MGDAVAVALTARAPKPPPLTVRAARHWARDNLFGSVSNTTLTVSTFLFVWFALIALPGIVEFPPFGILWFIVDAADWDVITTNRKLFFIGRFPSDETWRLWVSLFVFSGLAGLSWGLWSRIGPRLAGMAAGGLVLVFLFMAKGDVALLTAGTIGVFALTYAAGHAWLAPSRHQALARTVVVAGWLLSLALAGYLLRGVDSLLWGGLLLTIILTVVGIVASFPLGVLLAVGRASTFPVIRLFCVGYIELIRGVPLITILFMAKFILPLTVKSDTSISPLGVDIITIPGVEMDDVVRAMAAITIFSSAYLAEIIRGGLLAVPRGQVEAAQALGLGTTRILALIVLPQALRAVIPALVGQFIALFKDTSLVVIIGLTELLKAAQQVTAQFDFIGRQAEALLFVALIYWVVAFSMSRASQQLERTLGVGER